MITLAGGMVAERTLIYIITLEVEAVARLIFGRSLTTAAVAWLSQAGRGALNILVRVARAVDSLAARVPQRGHLPQEEAGALRPLEAPTVLMAMRMGRFAKVVVDAGPRAGVGGTGALEAETMVKVSA